MVVSKFQRTDYNFHHTIIWRVRYSVDCELKTRVSFVGNQRTSDWGTLTSVNPPRCSQSDFCTVCSIERLVKNYNQNEVQTRSRLSNRVNHPSKRAQKMGSQTRIGMICSVVSDGNSVTSWLVEHRWDTFYHHSVIRCVEFLECPESSFYSPVMIVVNKSVNFIPAFTCTRTEI